MVSHACMNIIQLSKKFKSINHTDMIPRHCYIIKHIYIQENIAKPRTIMVRDYYPLQQPSRHTDILYNNFIKGSSNNKTSNNQSPGKYNRNINILYSNFYIVEGN